jgi:cold shock CspA family protein
MKIIELFEKRKNPEQNPRIDVIQFLTQYKDRDDIYIHTTEVEKVGIYPKSSQSHDSPLGIYAFRLKDVWSYIEPYKKGLSMLPYYGGKHLYVLQSDIPSDFVDAYSETDLENDIEKLKKIYNISDDGIKRLKRTARTNLNFKNCPAGYLWGITKALIAGVDEFDEYVPVNTRKWTILLLKLGHKAFNDPGYGFIHGAESTQALFLDISSFKVIDHMNTNMKQKIIHLDNKQYSGGHFPKHLVMSGIPNTFFYNNYPEDLKNIKSWTVKHMSIDEYKTFLKFLPYNATGVIETLTLGEGSLDNFHTSSNVRKFFEKIKTIPANVVINSIHVGGQYPAMLLKYIPETFDVKQITISKYAEKYGFNDLPIKEKIVEI